ncbi:hypothetical protein DFH09DRAFT_1369506 [Mycena vulgaris]|nr:hypothetical protein DFH09DRAFT_1369506 [Mycena vulgaris]
MDGAASTFVTNDPALTDTELTRKLHSLERAKAIHLLRQLQVRLQYAKVDHGWQKQRINEVENLYFRQQRAAPPDPDPDSAASSSLPNADAPESLPDAPVPPYEPAAWPAAAPPHFHSQAYFPAHALPPPHPQPDWLHPAPPPPPPGAPTPFAPSAAPATYDAFWSSATAGPSVKGKGRAGPPG